MTKNDGLEKVQPGTPALHQSHGDLIIDADVDGVAERPQGLDDDLAGTEDIGINDVRLPRLCIAQGLSEELTPGKSGYIDTLKLFDMFNNMTKEVYGRGPITIVPVLRAVRRMEFRPRSEGGGLLDPNVPADDPRMQWTVDADGTRHAPKATTYTEFVVMLLRKGRAPEPIVLSIKGTNKFNRRASESFTTFIKLRRAAIYAGLYTISTASESNDKGTFGVPVIKNAGFINVDSAAGKLLHEYVKNFHDGLEGKEIQTEREPGDEDEFDGQTLEGQTVKTDM